jgi:hypothetical protein
MTNLLILSQATVATSVLWVWIMRRQAVISEFERFKLSEQVYIRVGAAKIALAFSMILSIWFPFIAAPISIGMGVMMAAAQYYHEQFGSTSSKRLPSLLLFLLCVYITFVTI